MSGWILLSTRFSRTLPPNNKLRDYFRHFVIGFIHIGRFITRLLRFFHFFLEGGRNFFLDSSPALSVDGVGNVSVQFHSAFDVLLCPVFGKGGTAVIAVFRSEMVFPAALLTVVAHFS